MRVFALISWYNERPDWLAASVTSLAPFVDHVVAVDGAYALFPEGRGQSERGQAEAIRETARAAGMGVTIHEPNRLWEGNEVQKRSYMFELVETMAKLDDDWYFVLDGDEVVTDHAQVKDKMAASKLDVAQACLWEHREHCAPGERPFVSAMVEQQLIRVMFRAVAGLRVIRNHYTYVDGRGRALWGTGSPPMEPAESFSDVKIEHRNKGRDLWRADGALEYYKKRDALNVEGLIP